LGEVLLQMSHINKAFQGVPALDDMNLTIHKGTVHALLGENGAGKSTLMKILTGVYSRDSGEIYYKGKPLDTSSVHKVLVNGISMIYQELNPIDNMSVAENIFCGHEPGNIVLNKKELFRKTSEILERLQIENISPEVKVKYLSVGQKQLLEIAKAIANRSELIIMDEPTSAITESECQKLFHTIRNLKKEGISFIYISHKLSEIFEICDELTIMRDGKYIDSGKVCDYDNDSLITKMVGRELTQIYPKEEIPLGEEVLQIKNLTVKGVFENVSFTVRRGEILGVAGLMGAGRTQVMETIFGCRKKTSGQIFLNGKEVQIRNPKEAIQKGLAFLTEDRKDSGCFLNMDVYNNVLQLIWKTCGKAFALNHRKGRDTVKKQISQYNIKTRGIRQPIRTLSGGNQQKVLLSRWLLASPDILILDEPTRGIDVGSKYEIYCEMMKNVREGKSIIMVSSELPEILGMSDRIIVMHEGKLTGILERNDADQEKILRYAAGIV